MSFGGVALVSKLNAGSSAALGMGAAGASTGDAKVAVLCALAGIALYAGHKMLPNLVGKLGSSIQGPKTPALQLDR